MRALCGAIITAGALIGLGLTSLGFGTRYAGLITRNPDTGKLEPIQDLLLSHMDKSLVFILVFLTAAAIIGMGITFVGLAYHHHRRLHEMGHHHANGATGPGTIAHTGTPASGLR